MFEEYDVVMAVKDLGDNVKRKSKGTIVLIHDKETEVYEVEFFDDTMQTTDILSVCGENLRLLWKKEL